MCRGRIDEDLGVTALSIDSVSLASSRYHALCRDTYELGTS